MAAEPLNCFNIKGFFGIDIYTMRTSRLGYGRGVRLRVQSVPIFLTLLIAWVAVWFVPYTGITQPATYPFFSSYSLEHGLSHATAHHIMQDKDGFIWISTRDGVNRFDGYNFEVFKHDPLNPNSLSYNTVWFTYQDRRGAIWMGTDGGGLNRYDPETGNFRHFFHYPDDVESISSNRVLEMHEAADSSLWIGLERGGLNRIRYNESDTSLSVRRYWMSDRRGSPLNTITDIKEFGEGLFYLATYGGGIIPFDTKTGKRAGPVLIPGKNVMVLRREGDILWAGTKYNGLAMINTRENYVQWFRHDPDESGSISSDFVWDLFRDSQGRLWAGTFGGGLNRLYSNYSNGRMEIRFDHYLHNDMNEASIPGDFISHVTEDRNGLLWVATDNGGVATFSPDRQFSMPRLSDEESRMLDGVHINERYAADEGEVWLATNEGVLLQDPARGTIRRVPIEGATDVVVNTLSLTGGGAYVLAGTNQGLFVTRTDRPAFRRVYLGKGGSQESDGINLDRVFDVESTSAGDLWISTNEGVWNVTVTISSDIHFELRRHLTSTFDGRGLSSEHTGELLATGSWLWIGTSGNGLNRLHLDSGEIDHFFTADSSGTKSPMAGALKVRDLLYDDKGHLWLATYGGGVVRMSGIFPEGSARGRPGEVEVGGDAGISYLRFTAQDGLPSNTVKHVEQDSSGTVWVTTQAGLGRLVEEDTDNLYFRPVYAPVGSFNVNMNGIHPAGDGTFIITRNTGYLHFNPYFSEKVRGEPEIAITGVEVNGIPKYDSMAMQRLDTLRLNHDENYLNFSFSLLDYASPAQNSYHYRLLGLHENWLPAGNRNRASYTGLEPGSYRFMVRGESADGRTGQSRELAVLISPPFWATSWFMALSTLTGLLLLYGGYRYRLSSLLQVERTRQRIADDLHDDIGARMSSVALLLDMASKDGCKQVIDRARAVVREVNSDLRDTIWFVDSDNDDLLSLVDRMKQSLRSQLPDTQLNMNIPESLLPVRLEMSLRRNIFLMFKEVIHNIHRHAEACVVELKIHMENRNLVITVRDNGKGFNPEEVQHGRGMETLKRRAQASSLSWHIKSEPGEGTEVQIRTDIA